MRCTHDQEEGRRGTNPSIGYFIIQYKHRYLCRRQMILWQRRWRKDHTTRNRRGSLYLNAIFEIMNKSMKNAFTYARYAGLSIRTGENDDFAAFLICYCIQTRNSKKRLSGALNMMDPRLIFLNFHISRHFKNDQESTFFGIGLSRNAIVWRREDLIFAFERWLQHATTFLLFLCHRIIQFWNDYIFTNMIISLLLTFVDTPTLEWIQWSD